MTLNPNLEKIIDHCRDILGSDCGIDPLQHAVKQKFVNAKGEVTTAGQKLLVVLQFSSEVEA